MKNFKLHFLFIATLLLFSSCQEEYPLPSNDYPVLASNNATQPGVSMWGKFKLVSAVMYVVNNETNQKTVYNHFGPNKTVSSLRWGGSIYDIETIIKDSTTFSFYQPMSYPGYGKFVLNGDTTKHYAVYYVGMNKSIVEDPINGMTQQMMGGSARPFSGQTIDYATGMIRIQIQEVQGSIDGYNCRYWSELTFKKIESW
jgi:hypothetical protein